MAYLGPSSAPSRGALLRRHRLPRYRHRLSRAMGKRPSGLGRFPGFPARAFARVESRAARLTVLPVYGPIRYRSNSPIPIGTTLALHAGFSICAYCHDRWTVGGEGRPRCTQDLASADQARHPHFCGV